MSADEQLPAEGDRPGGQGKAGFDFTELLSGGGVDAPERAVPRGQQVMIPHPQGQPGERTVAELVLPRQASLGVQANNRPSSVDTARRRPPAPVPAAEAVQRPLLAADKLRQGKRERASFRRRPHRPSRPRRPAERRSGR